MKTILQMNGNEEAVKRLIANKWNIRFGKKDNYLNTITVEGDASDIQEINILLGVKVFSPEEDAEK